MNTRRTWRLVAAVVACAAAYPAFATEYHVPSEYPTIDGAIGACRRAGGEVVVADGTYTGAGFTNLYIMPDGYARYPARVRSANGPAACIIDCEGSGRFLSVGDSAEYVHSIDGLTIVNGNVSDPSSFGGAGGAVSCTSRFTIKNCRFASNTADDGGAIAFWAVSSGVSFHLVNCTMISNSARYRGGGVYQHAYAEGMSGVQMVNCAVVNSTAGWYGGGIYTEGLSLQNCTIAGNTAGWYGGGLYGNNAAHCSIYNTVIASNTGRYGHDIALDNDTQLTLEYTDVYGDDEALWVGGGSFVIWGMGNINVDPLFADPDGGNVRLRLESPCVDAGSNNFVGSDWADLDGDGDYQEPVPFDCDGNPRIARFTVDMGAYEVPFGDLNCDRRLDFADINPFVLALTGQAAYEAAFPDCDWLLADCNGDGYVDFADINPFVALLSGG